MPDSLYLLPLDKIPHLKCASIHSILEGSLLSIPLTKTELPAMDSDQEEQAVEPGLKDVVSIVLDKFFDQMRHTMCFYIVHRLVYRLVY